MHILKRLIKILNNFLTPLHFNDLTCYLSSRNEILNPVFYDKPVYNNFYTEINKLTIFNTVRFLANFGISKQISHVTHALNADTNIFGSLIVFGELSSNRCT